MNPHMTQKEQELLKKYLKKTETYFEFGCGGSTILANTYQNIKKMWCVDSDQQWLDQTCKPKKITPIYIDIGKTGEWGVPLNSKKEKNWYKYSSAITTIKHKPLLVLIDGRFRVACAIKTRQTITNKGYVLLHDCGRQYYESISKLYSVVERVDKLVVLKPKHIHEIGMYDLYKNDWR